MARVESERILRKHANLVYDFKLENNNKDLVTYQKIGTQCVNACIADLTKHGREVEE